MHTAEQIEAARAALGLLDPGLAVAHAATPPFAWRTKPSGFAELIKLVLEQQVSVASAIAIWKRLEAGLGTVDSASILGCDIETLKGFGLSGPKARYVHAVAEAEACGAIDFVALRELDDLQAVAKLIAIKGIGRWTAEAYLMGCEGRTDLFPAGDLALQEGLRMADGAAIRLTEKALYARAEAWRPFRGVAAHLLWAYYTGVKRGLIVPPAPAASLEVG
ncbi:MAG TPA: DNA-3-methyladenine glycosylase 2 family protein [Stellaceae bacterium]|jgi:DNA-3-methyladenine glycosylase II|nr:DNA-3-methyladenine glycosylase 2 family protein [Stellaceae bacterium]